MLIVKVTYTAKPGFAGQNQKNIQNVMADLRKIKSPGINYNCCLCADGKTFIHTSFFESDENRKKLNEMPAFIDFQEQLKSAGFEVPPKQELLTLVGSSADIFKPHVL
jgi:hypothetical protein